jgi:purine-binding chemotaxis protein CheW
MSETGLSGNDQKQRIFKARAEILAREPLGDDAQDERIEIVEFLLADERYALESAYIRGVYALDSLTPLPCTPAFVAGIINLRGRIIAVIDLRTFFDLPRNGLSDTCQVIVLSDNSMEFGILANAIITARMISRTTLQPALPTLTGVRADYLLGITQDRLAVLDGGRILAERRIVVHEEV